MKRVLLLSQFGDWHENSRFRFYQYISYLEKKGYKIESLPLFTKKRESVFIKKNNINFYYMFLEYTKRFFHLFLHSNYDALWLDSEIFHGIPFGLEGLLVHPDKPVILDISNAHFHKYTKGKNLFQRLFLKHKIPIWLQRGESVLVSTPELRDYSQAFNPNSVLLPFSINLEEYEVEKPLQIPNDAKTDFVIGWTGSLYTTRFLSIVYDALKELKRVFPIKLYLLGGDPNWKSPVHTEYIPYSPENEKIFLQKIDIGIQPLPFSLRETGNPGVRILKYMANYKPIVSTPIGAANLYIQHSTNGFFAKNTDDWYLSLRLLIEDEVLRYKMGESGRKLVEEEFAFSRAKERLLSVFQKNI